jgi:hypothetical protein
MAPLQFLNGFKYKFFPLSKVPNVVDDVLLNQVIIVWFALQILITLIHINVDVKIRAHKCFAIIHSLNLNPSSQSLTQQKKR